MCPRRDTRGHVLLSECKSSLRRRDVGPDAGCFAAAVSQSLSDALTFFQGHPDDPSQPGVKGCHKAELAKEPFESDSDRDH